MTSSTSPTEQSGAAESTIPDKEFTIGQGKVWLSLLHSAPDGWARILFTTIFPPESDCAPFAPEQQLELLYVDDYEARRVFFSYTQQDAETFYAERLAFFINPLNRKGVTW